MGNDIADSPVRLASVMSASPAVSQLRYSQDLTLDQTGDDELEIHRGRGMGTDRGEPLIEEGVKETLQRVDKIVNRGENSQSNFPQSNEDSNESDELEVHRGRGVGTDRGDPLIEEGVTETPQKVGKSVNRGGNSQSNFLQSIQDSNESAEELSDSISSTCAIGSNPSQDVLEAVDVVVGSSPKELRGKLGPKYGGNQSPGEVKVAHDVAGGEGGGVLLRIVPEGIWEITHSGSVSNTSKGDDAVCTSRDKAQVDEHYQEGARRQVRAQGENVGLLSEQSGVSGGSLTSEVTSEVLTANQARVIDNNRNEHECSREGPSSSPENGKPLRPLGIDNPLVGDTSGINKRKELLGSEFKTQFKSRDRDKGPGNSDVGAHWVVQSLHNAKGELGRNFVGRLGFLIGVT